MRIWALLSAVVERVVMVKGLMYIFNCKLFMEHLDIMRFHDK